MQVYYGTKRVTAEPRWRYVNEDGSKVETPTAAPNEPGYAVHYPDGYSSWSPAPVFEAAYHPANAMNFEGALCAMREGRKVRRVTIDAPGIAIWLDGDTFHCQREGYPIGTWMPSTLSILSDWMLVD